MSISANKLTGKNILKIIQFLVGNFCKQNTLNYKTRWMEILKAANN